MHYIEIPQEVTNENVNVITLVYHLAQQKTV